MHVLEQRYHLTEPFLAQYWYCSALIPSMFSCHSEISGAGGVAVALSICSDASLLASMSTTGSAAWRICEQSTRIAVPSGIVLLSTHG